MFARHAVICLCLGSYFLGVSTALLVAQFNDYASTWQRATTLVVAALAVITLATSVYFVRKSDDAQNTGLSGNSSIDTREGRLTPTPSVFHSETRADSCGKVGGPGEAVGPTVTAEQGQPVSVVEPGSLLQGVEGSEPGPRADVDERRPLPQADDLIKAWDNYRQKGDGHFNVQGLQRQLDNMLLDANVSASDRVGASNCVLVVQTQSGKSGFFVLPSFAKSARAVGEWFDDSSGGALTGRIEQVLEVAEGRWTKTGVDIVRRGFVA